MFTRAGDFSFMIQGPSSNICWNDSSIGGTDFTSLSGEKDPAKSYFTSNTYLHEILGTFTSNKCLHKILAGFTNTIASESKLPDTSYKARLISLSNARSVWIDVDLTSIGSGTQLSLFDASEWCKTYPSKSKEKRPGGIQVTNSYHFKNFPIISLRFSKVN